MTPNDENTIRNYLLQELAEEDQARVEKRIMTDRDFFDQLQLAEGELVEEYVLNELEPRERERFERFFLASPEGRQQVSFEIAFHQHMARQPLPVSAAASDSQATQTLPFSIVAFFRNQRAAAVFAIAFVVLLAASGVWLPLRERQRQMEIERLQAQVRTLEDQLSGERIRASRAQADSQEARERNTALEHQLASLKNERAGSESSLAGTILSVVLMPGVLRDGSTSAINLPRTVQTVKLTLRVPSTSYNSFNAELKKEGGESIRHARLNARRVSLETRVTLNLPAGSLSAGFYVLTLSGIDAEGAAKVVGEYPFTIEKD